MVTSNELWQFSWIILNKSGFWISGMGEVFEDEKGEGKGTGLTICGFVWL
jgi:hypothetical protein